MLGLGFGDCGKGHFINTLARRWQAHTVVRFSGGAQAGHNVIESPAGGSPPRHHTFSQFASGTFIPGVASLLIHPMIVHPTALLAEAEALQRAGVDDALPRLMIDGRCRITTPYHQAAGRLRELRRGGAAHGTCGVGVGETVLHDLRHPGHTLRYEDLAAPFNRRTGSPLDKLHAIRDSLLRELAADSLPAGNPAVEEEIRTLRDETLAGRWLNIAMALARQCPPAPADRISGRLRTPGCVLFEGAQGILLDEGRGFHPHTTWSSITTTAVETAARNAGVGSSIEHYGALRTYPTRHGAGPFPTRDEALDEWLPEPHNPDAGWQGRFRRGHPDALLMRYALESAGTLHGLLVSHLDVFRRGVPLKWCSRYLTGTSSSIQELPVGSYGDLSHQAKLAALLDKASPGYDPRTLKNETDYLDRLSGLTPLPVLFRSYGNTAGEVRGG